MFSSLRSRLWLSYAFLIVTALTVVAFVLFVFLLRSPLLYRQTLDRIQAAGGVITTAPTAERIVSASQAFDVRVLIYSANGILISDTSSDKPPILLPVRPRLARLLPTIRDATGKVWLYSVQAMPDGTWLMVAAPRAKEPIAAIFTDEIFLPLVEGGVIALLLSLILAFLIARWVADPLQNVVSAARTVPIGEAKAVETGGPHEVRELTRAFNAMLQRVQSTQKSQRDFVANVSHELKTPLTSIQGFAQAILDGTADSPDARRQAAEVIYNEAGRMHRMALDLLDLARLEAGTADLKMSPVNMAALLNAVAEKFSPLALNAGIQLKTEIASDLPVINGDGDRLAQVFTNLVDNALKFTPRDGLVVLRAVQDKGEIQVSVSDTGKGIPADAIPHIFDRFYQADSSRAGGGSHGAGLGLAIAQEIVTAHGGRISVRSTEGRGAAFLVHLPLTAKLPERQK
jgi:signal transduction histidine kinase